MSFIRRANDGRLVVCRAPRGCQKNRGHRGKGVCRDWWLANLHIYLGNIKIPSPLHGKRVKFYMEIMKDD